MNELKKLTEKILDRSELDALSYVKDAESLAKAVLVTHRALQDIIFISMRGGGDYENAAREAIAEADKIASGK